MKNLIQSSIEEIDPDSITRSSSIHSIPLIFIRNLDELKNLISENEYAYLTAINFKGIYGEKVILPRPDGKIGKVIVCCKTERTHQPTFLIGNEISKLPAGGYSLKNFPDNLNIKELYLGFYFSFYSFDLYKESCEDPSKLAKPRLFDSPLTDHSNLIYFAESEFISRDLINYPANHLGPSELEDYVKSFAEFHKTKFSSIKGEELKIQNLPLIHDVGRASEQAPRLLEIEYGKKNASYSITLVGKGVCFDSGGLNLKNPSGMRNMKKDMAGAAAVLGLGHYLIRSKLNLNLRILIPCVENSVSSNAFRQGDVLKSRIGKYVEVQNTDAEGRLILADALSLAVEKKPDLLVSFATLTGAARVAMGSDLTPFFATNSHMANLVEAGGRELFDPVWQLPFYKDYEDQLRSKIADLNNAPSGGMAGSITAALFLKHFTEDHQNFMHFDIFGWNQKSRPGKSYGGLLQGARSLAAGIEKVLGEKNS